MSVIDLANLTGQLASPTARAHESHALGWLAGYRNAKTRASYALSITRWFEFCERHGVDPMVVLRAHVELYQRSLEAFGYKPRTIQGRIAAVASFYTYLVDEDLLARSPMRGVKRPVIERRSPTAWLTRPQLSDLISGAEQLGVTAHALVLLLAFNGLRIAEACSLDIESMAKSGFYDSVTFIRKGGREGSAVLAAPTSVAIHLAIGGRSTGPIFLTRAGTRMNQAAAQRILDQAVVHVRGAHGRITPHSLRHSWTTAANDAGVSVDQLVHDGGWTDARMPTSYYAHGQDNPVRAATHAVAGLVLST